MTTKTPSAQPSQAKTHERESKLEIAAALAAQSTEIICRSRDKASDLGASILQNSICYLYAALIADVACDVRSKDWIGPYVAMDDGTTKPSESFLFDHLFGVVFAPMFARGGEKFLSEVRRRAEVLVIAKADGAK